MERLAGKVPFDEHINKAKLGAPVVTFNVSATLLPVFMRCQRQSKTNVDCFLVHVTGEYSGIPAMSPRFLTDNELRKNESYWSPRVDELYTDAHPEDPAMQKEAVLVLDAANPRVNAEDNIFQRAAMVRRAYPRFTTISVSGGGRIEVVLTDGTRYAKDTPYAKDIWELVDDAAAAYDSDDEETLNPEPQTLNSKSSTLNPQP